MKQIGLNSLWFFFSRILAQLLHLVFIGIIARSLGTVAFGAYVLYALILFIGNIFTTYGTDALLIREITRDGKITASFSASAWVQIILSCFWILALWLVSILLEFDAESRNSLLILNLTLIPFSFKTVFSSALRAFERMEAFFALSLINILTQTLLAYFFIKSSDDLLLLCVLLFLNQVLNTIFNYFACKFTISNFSSVGKPVFLEIKKIFRSGIELALYFPLSAFYQSLNLFAVSFLSGQEMTGIFSASTRIMEGIKIGHFSLSNGMMSTMAKEMTPAVKTSLTKTFYLLLSWSVFAGIGTFFFAKLGIHLIYGSEYLDSVPVLKILGFVLIPYTFSLYFSLQLIMTGKESIVLRATLICVFISMLVYYYLISKYGLIGAAWSTFISELIYAVFLLIFSKKYA